MCEQTFRLTGAATELAALRHSLEGLLRDAGWAPREMGDVLLAASELATNACLHTDSSCEVRCTVEDVVTLEVTDRDAAHLPRVRRRDSSPGGMGLRIVEQLAERWWVEARRDGKAVLAQLRRPPRPTS